MEPTSPLKNPSRTVQAWCEYWLMSSDGSNANTEGHDASSTQASTIPGVMKASACACTFGIRCTSYIKGCSAFDNPPNRALVQFFGLLTHTAALARCPGDNRSSETVLNGFTLNALARLAALKRRRE